MFNVSNAKPSTPKRLMTSYEVENYVKKIGSQLQSPFEKKSKAFAFAQLYFDAKDFELAKMYLKDFLTIQDRDFRVYNLLGETYEALNDYPQALAAFKRSLELCSTQKDILLKVVDLCCKAPIDPLRAKVWAEKGSKSCHGHPAVFNLKWYLLSQEKPKNYEEMEVLLADELTRRAREPSLHIKLVKMYLEAELYKQAFQHCESVQKTGAFDNEIDWLECICEAFEIYKNIDDSQKILSCLCYARSLSKLIPLHLKSSSVQLCEQELRRLDSFYNELHNTPLSVDNYTSELKDCLNEIRGQLYLHVAVYFMKLAKEDGLPWMQANRMAASYLMASWQVEAPYITSKLFSRHSPLKKPNHPYHWSAMACSRLSETGHLILSFESQFGEEWLKNCINDFCNMQGQKTLVDTLYNNQILELSQSFLATDEAFLQVEVKIPEPNLLVQYNEVAVAEYASNLHLIIWLGLHWDNFNEHIKPGVGVVVGRLFEGISLDVKNIKNCHFSNLCLRDIEAFIYAVIRSSKSIHLECGKKGDEPKLLPVEICPNLVTSLQQEWWQAAYSLYTGKLGNQCAAKLKVILQKGLETIRCVRDHGIDPRILMYISVAFFEKAVSIESSKKQEYDYQDHWESLHSRATYYMKEAIKILEVYKSNRVLPLTDNPLILPLSDPILPDDVVNMLNKNYIRLADASMLDNNFKDALKYYNEVKSLHSMYSQAQIYIQLASQSDTGTFDGEKDLLYYMTKAKEKLSICISNAEHSPDLKQSLIKQLQDLQLLDKAPVSKKSLVFQRQSITPLPEEADVYLETSAFDTSNLEASSFERSILQQQLEAKECENQSLKQTLAMYKAQIDNIQYQQQNIIHAYPSPGYPSPHIHPGMMMQTGIQPSLVPLGVNSMLHPKTAPQVSIVRQGLVSVTPQSVQPIDTPQSNLHQSFVYQNVRPHPSVILPQIIQTPDAYNMLNMQYAPQQVYMPVPQAPITRSHSGSNPMTPVVSSNGIDSQGSDMWWDSFSPQPSFEKGYFSGLSEHVEQLREKSGDVEAPTLKDETSKTPQEKERVISVKGTPNTPALELDDIYVEPIVKLTSQSNLVTGEEGEEEKFVHRAKLYRFDKGSNQWKERGVGEVKILWNDATKKARITMRRDHVLRVCCNHIITPEMFLEQKAGTTAAWSWFTAADASSEDIKSEQFTIKFRTQEKADEFQEIFLKYQNLSAAEKPQLYKDPNVKNKPMNILSAPKLGSWNCNTCLVSNPPEIKECLACKASNPKSVAVSHSKDFISEARSTQSAPIFSFKVTDNIQTSPEGKPVFVFASKPSKDPSNPFLSQKAPIVSENESSGFQFELNTSVSEATPTTTETKPNPFAGFSFKIDNTSTSVSVSSKSNSPFSGFSFSTSSSSTASSNNDISAQNYPIMSSLLKQTPSKPQVQTTPLKPTITGMEKLPVFERGVVNSSVDPSSFWTSASPQKMFFTGNTTGLDSIGHKEDPRTMEDEELSLDQQKNDDDNGDGDYYYGEENEQIEYYDDDGDYYDENGHYYGDDQNPYEEYEDYDYDPDEDFGYENDDNEYQPSHASSSRRGSCESKENEENEGFSVKEEMGCSQKYSELKNTFDNDLVITIVKEPTFAQKAKASRLLLPLTYFLYENQTPCTGCSGCDDEYIKKKNANVKQDVLGEKQAKKEPVNLFAELAALPEFGGKTTASFIGAGTQLFVSEQSEDKDNEEESEYDPHVDAIVQVTKLKTIKTGEEEDEILFKHRCKLYRYDGQWKERGVGEIKLTQNTVTGYRRVLMRRELIHKLCANHAIMPDMELKPLMSSDRSWVWFTPSDYSEGLPPIPSQFCVKFSNLEVAGQFKTIFETCKEAMGKVLPKMDVQNKSIEPKNILEMASKDENALEQTVESRTKVSTKTLAAKFSLQPGQWECTSCLVRNDENKSNCISCNNPNLKKVDASGTSGTLAAPFHFGSSTASSNIKVSVPSTSFSGFQFTYTPTTFGASSTTPLFSFSLKKSDALTSTAAIFTTPQAKLGSKVSEISDKMSPNDHKNLANQTNNADTNSPSVLHDEDNDIYVEAIAHVSKLDHINTGEENDEIIFSNRVKLFRFDSNTKAWKERGIGELKLTRDKTKNNCRVVMRREQVHKLCANHTIVTEMELKPFDKSNKTWAWFTQADISDGEAKAGQFCARFKTSEMAAEFKLCFDKCRAIAFSKVTSNDEQTSNERTSNEQTSNAIKVTNLKSKFALKGGWSCTTCLVVNQSSVQICAACQSPNPNAVASSNISSSTNTSFNSKSDCVTKNNLFTFGASSSATSGFSFGAPSNSPSAGFTFAAKPNLFTFGGPVSQVKESTPKSSFMFGIKPEHTPVCKESNFEADPNTWECPICLAKNNGSRDICRQCQSAKQKTPVVRLDPEEFSKPINFKLDDSVSKTKSSEIKNRSPSFNFSETLSATDEISDPKNKANIDQQLMPPPSVLPPPNILQSKKVSPKENEKKTTKSDSVFWMPQGLSTDFKFTFGISPLPSLSAASSIDDLREKPASEQVQSLFGDKPFAFTFDAPRELSTISSNNATATVTSPNTTLEVDDSECSAEFAPLVSLSHVSHATGEEEETVLFSERCKMFRFDKQWKERGIGELKLLQHKKTKQCRLLLRRDQTHKLCANHMLVKGMVIKPMGTSKNAYVWKSNSDISDGDPTEQTFAARFKLEERAKAFADAFNSACSDGPANICETAAHLHIIEIESGDEGDEKIVVNDEEIKVSYEPKIDNALQIKAKRLLLPETFYNETSLTNNRRTKLTSKNEEKNGGERAKDMTSDKESKSDLILTRVKTSEVPEAFLLPKSFYNYTPDAKLIDENSVINTHETIFKDKKSSDDELFSVYHSELSDAESVFSTKGYLFRYLADEYHEFENLNDVKIEKKTNAYYITVTDPAGNKQLVIKLSKKLELSMPADSKTVFHLDTCYGKYALKFSDMPAAESFLSVFEDVKDLIHEEEKSANEILKDVQIDNSKSGIYNPPIFGGSFDKISFATLASCDKSGFSNNAGKTFAGSGTGLFQSNNKAESSKAEHDDDADVNIYVEPIVQLKSVAVESGEENEGVIFNERCKLYRFDDKKWKERGVGEVKLLRHKETGKARLVMRRDQVHIVCANHLLTSEMRLEPFKNNELTVTWNAFSDVSDGSPCDCIFAIKFKNLDLLSSFKESFRALCEGKPVNIKPLNINLQSAEDQPFVFGSCDPKLITSIRTP